MQLNFVVRRVTFEGYTEVAKTDNDVSVLDLIVMGFMDLMPVIEFYENEIIYKPLIVSSDDLLFVPLACHTFALLMQKWLVKSMNI